MSMFIAAVLAVCAGCAEGADPLPGEVAGSAGSAGTAGGAGTAGSTPAAGSGGQASGGPGDVYGSMNVSFVEAIPETMSPARTSIIGKFNDGPTPNVDVWKVEREADGCKLYVPVRVSCIPACGSAAACTADDMCTPYPKPMTVGTITLSGVGAQPLALDPVANNYQPKGSVAYPPCSEGDEVKLAAAGVEITARCIAPLQFDGKFTLTKGQPLPLRWGAPGQPTLAKIAVKLDISHHGGSTGKVECEVADNGSLDVPAAFVDALLDLGYAGFPTVAVTRKVVAMGSGRASNAMLTISAPVERPVEIPGLKSCSEDSDCPMGQACQSNRACK
jgi:hypothetical protein